MKRYPVHVCLVSAQASANLIPCCDPEMAPEEVVLLVGPGMELRAEALAEVLGARGIKVCSRRLSEAWEPEKIRADLAGFAAEIDPERMVLNATGGTKPMSDVLRDMFREANAPVFYQIPNQNRAVWLSGHEGGFPLRADLKVEELVTAHGFRVLGCDRSLPGHSELTTALKVAQKASKYMHFTPTLNYLTAEAIEREVLQTGPVGDYYLGQSRFMELVDLFVRGGFVSWQEDRLRFRDDKARAYVCGGWLEVLVYGALRHLADKGHIQLNDCVLDLNVETRAHHRPNQVDVAVVADNRLWLIECKTRRYNRGDGPQAAAEKVSMDLYKMDHLRDLGGLGARSLLVSLQSLGDAALQRARDLRIDVLSGADLEDIGARLLEWMGGQK
ncbi:MAG: DUF1887 family protein [Deltaproteobacteria bacterium]|nr:MAG: DUF1887 family protein [Deltaproteobacteria bacterium]